MTVVKKKLLVAVGTRPEAIKLAPLVLAAKSRAGINVVLCNTGQHRQMCDQVLKLFGLTSDIDLDIMQSQQTLTDVTVRILTRLQPHLESLQPDWIIVQGDTTTTFAAALSAFYQKIPVAHVEAGLRTGDIYAPWPEEMNRRLVSKLATLHFPPTTAAAMNLQREGIEEDRLLIAGNTGIDALKWMAARLSTDEVLRANAREAQRQMGVPGLDGSVPRPYVLVTGHRRESFGSGFEGICDAIGALALRFIDHDFIYPMHPNPKVRETVLARLGDKRYKNVYLIQPLEYLPFIDLMSRASLILTDSGGVQEEAPSLGKRVIVLRDLTERMEGLETGMIRMAGTDARKIVAYAEEALIGKWAIPSKGCDVYGDGHASERIIDAILAHSSSTDAIE